MELQQTLSELVQALIAIVVDTGAGWFVGPVLTLYVILRVFRWIVSSTKGGADYEDIQSGINENTQKLRRTGDRIRNSYRRRY